jgi:serine phosphatase RsbU (regulator of sigma subunit)
MRTRLERLINLGTSRLDDVDEIQRTRMGNLLTLVLIALASAYVPILGFLGGAALGMSVVGIVAAFASVLVASHLGHTRLSRLALVLIVSGVLTIYAALLGEDAGAHFMFFSVLVLPALTFGSQDRWWLAVSLVTPLAGLTALVVTDFSFLGPPIVSAEAQGIIQISVIPTSAVSLLAGVRYFVRVNERNRRGLDARNRDLRRILDNVDQGLFLVRRDGVIDPECSAIVERWFGPLSPETTFSELLDRFDGAACDRFERAWSSFRETDDVDELLAQLPREARDAVRQYELRYQPIGEPWSRLMVIISDVSLLREREVELARRRARQQREVVGRARLDEQLQIAKKLQLSILPEQVDVPGLTIAYRVIPADDVGGDYVDVLPAKDGAWIAMGDVSGHGINAGMTMFMVQSAMAAICALADDRAPSDVVAHLNGVLYENIRVRRKADDYVTFVALRFSSDGRVRFSGAHLDILVRRVRTGALQVIHTRGGWIGAFPTIDHALFDDALVLEPGDLLVLYTDGVTEAMNASGEQFGPDRLQALVSGADDADPRLVRDSVLAALSRWNPERPKDDVTILTMRYDGPS